MFALLSPRLWIALAIAGVLAFTHFTAYRKGKANVTAAWDLDKARANSEARSLEQARQRRADEAAQLAAARAHRITADASNARAELNRMRSELDATRDFAAQSSSSAAKSVAALSDVFEQCSREYQSLAEIADRHSSDAVNLREAWPQ